MVAEDCRFTGNGWTVTLLQQGAPAALDRVKRLMRLGIAALDGPIPWLEVL